MPQGKRDGRARRVVNGAPMATPSALSSVSPISIRPPCAPSRFGRHVQLPAWADYITVVFAVLPGRAVAASLASQGRKSTQACRRCSSTAPKPISRFGGRRSMPAAGRRAMRRPETTGVNCGGRTPGSQRSALWRTAGGRARRRNRKMRPGKPRLCGWSGGGGRSNQRPRHIPVSQVPLAGPAYRSWQADEGAKARARRRARRRTFAGGRPLFEDGPLFYTGASIA